MAVYEWKEHRIEVEFVPFGIFAWLLAGFVVTVQGRRYFPSIERFGFNTRTEFVMRDGDSTVGGVVRSLAPMVFVPAMRYVVEVDEVVIAQDRQFMKRWYLSLAAWVLFMVVGCLALLGLLGVIFAVKRWTT